MQILKLLNIVVVILTLGACTAITVQPMSHSLNAKHICIKKNEKVIRADFLPTLLKGFDKYGFTTEVYEDVKPKPCKFIATYTATQVWDLGMVLSDAELWIHHQSEQVAYGKFHLRAGGGFSLMKWQGAEKKFIPVMDKLLIEYQNNRK